MKVFPSTVNSLDVQSGYGMQDLLADLAELTPEIVAQPNVQVIDITGTDPEESTDSEEFLQALDEYGSGVTVLAAPTGAEQKARGGDRSAGEAAAEAAEVRVRAPVRRGWP